MTFPELPPVDPHGFWSITLYDQHHFFAPNPIDRFSLGTKSKQLRYEADGAVVIHVQSDRPNADKCRTGCRRRRGVLTHIRAYWPLDEMNEGGWTPPPVILVRLRTRLAQIVSVSG